MRQLNQQIFNFPWQVYKKNVECFLKDLNNGDYYKLSSSSEITLLSSAFAVILQYILGLKVNHNCLNNIIDSYDLDAKHFKCISQNDDAYFKQQTRYFCRLALFLWNKKLDTSSNIKESILTIEKWVNDLDWEKPWDTCNILMFKLDDLLNPPTTKNNIDLGIKLLESLIKKRNNIGFWGNEKSSLLEQMCGSMHLFPFYLKNNYQINSDTIIDSTLKLLHTGGCFYPLVGGGACPDYDGICTLIWFWDDNIPESVLHSIFCNHLSNQDKGLFVDSIRFKNEKVTSKFPAHLMPYFEKTIHYYSNSQELKYKIDEPNIWACLVRSLSIAMIQNKLSIKNPIRYSSIPGIAWNINE